MEFEERKNYTSKAQKILNGEKATEILKFLAKMANITVRKFLSENKKIYNHGGIPNYAIAKNTYK